MPYTLPPELVSGHSLLDEDHRKIFDLYHRLKTEEFSSRLKRLLVIDQLCDYCVHHMYVEEEILARYQYDKLEEHRAQHHEIQNALASVLRQFIQRDTLDSEALAFIENRFIEHIRTMDLIAIQFMQQHPISLREKTDGNR